MYSVKTQNNKKSSGCCIIQTSYIYFDQMVDRVYRTELQLNRANSSDTETPFSGLNLCISNGQFPPKFMINGTILILI